MSPAGWWHTGFGVLALILGGITLVLPKANQRHKVFGYSYAFCMVILNLTSFLIYKLLGHFGPFHVLALISLITLAAGLAPAIMRRPKDTWIEKHYRCMAHSYIGLWAATAAEVGIRIPFVQENGLFAQATILGTAIAMLVGNYLLSRFHTRRTLSANPT